MAVGSEKSELWKKVHGTGRQCVYVKSMGSRVREDVVDYCEGDDYFQAIMALDLTLQMGGLVENTNCSVCLDHTPTAVQKIPG